MTRYETDGITVLAPTEDLREGEECDRLEDALLRLAERGALIVIDVTRVQNISAHCLGVLAHAHQVATEHGGSIALCHPTRMERWLLAKTGLADVIPVYDDVEAASRALAAGRAVA